MDPLSPTPLSMHGREGDRAFQGMALGMATGHTSTFGAVPKPSPEGLRRPGWEGWEGGLGGRVAPFTGTKPPFLECYSSSSHTHTWQQRLWNPRPWELDTNHLAGPER